MLAQLITKFNRMSTSFRS